jgi:hypothetical protein
VQAARAVEAFILKAREVLSAAADARARLFSFFMWLYVVC